MGLLSKTINELKDSNKQVWIRKKNGFFFSGYVVDVDDDWVQIDDRKSGMTLIAVSEIEQVKEWREER